MKAATWLRIRELFDRAVELPEVDRLAFLERTCAGEPEVRAGVERMLRSDESAAGFLEDSSSILERAILPQVGTRIGRYTLLRVLASGGMGTVFEAIQDEPRRTVALKTLRYGLSSPERLQRFRFEAEVLGNLRHPSIAQIFEAGTHEEAGEVVPFFAMELVGDARDLLSYAREEDLALAEKLELFLEVCEAVQHGHQKGVIHRDLKPGNILVDPEGRAKVIDFGVAHATNPAAVHLGDVATQTGQILGTFAYMAPEQLAGDPSALDVRSDVYALGILLFELVEGRRPHELEGKPPAEALRTIQEETPRPSASTPRELGWILYKTLAKEPERRYGSVSELATDLRRFVRHEPVLAAPPSVRYRVMKFVRRNRWPFAAAIAVLAALSIGFVRADLARRAAERAAARAEKVNAFLSHVLTSISPLKDGREALVADALDEAARSLDQEIPDDPEIRALTHGMIGESYLSLGLLKEAEPHLAVARDGFESPQEGGDARSIRAWSSWGELLVDSEKFPEAASWSRALLPCAEKLLGPEHAETIRIRRTLAGALQGLGSLDEAEELLQESLAIVGARYGERDERRIDLLVHLAAVHLDSRASSRLEEAQRLLESAVELGRELLPEGHSSIQIARFNLVKVLSLRGRDREAEELCRGLLSWSKAHVGADSRHTLALTHTLANVLTGLDKLDEALPLYEEALRIADSKYGPASKSAIRARQTLAVILLRTNELVEAEALVREALDLADGVLPPDSIDRASIQVALGWTLDQQGRYEESVPIFRAVVESLERLLGPQDPHTLDAMRSLAESLGQMERWSEAAEVAATVAERATGASLQEFSDWARGFEAEAPDHLNR